MNDSQYQELLQTAWRRKLMPEEEACLHRYLAADPAAQAAWDQECALTDQLLQLRNAPVSTNFSRLVMQAVEAAEQEASRAATPVWLKWSRHWLPRFATASLLLAMALGGFYQYQALGRARMVRDVALVMNLMETPGLEVMQDYEAIRQLPTASDEDLLAALQ